MWHRTILKAVLVGLLAVCGLALTGCGLGNARDTAYTGDQVHERHATGMQSQAGDI